MKTLSFVGMAVLCCLLFVKASALASGGKILIAYFSLTQTTKELAVQIQKATHGDLFEITPLIAYPTAYKQTTTIARREKEENARPALKTHVENMDEYDVIFLGYPTWWGDLPMAVYTFLQEYNFAGKTIILFGTSGGSGAPKTNAQLGNKIPNATIIQGINVKGSISQKDVDKWLKSIGIGK